MARVRSALAQKKFVVIPLKTIRNVSNNALKLKFFRQYGRKATSLRISFRIYAL